MKRFLVFSPAFVVWFTVGFLASASGSATFGSAPEDPNCMGAAPQNADFKTIPYTYVFTGVCDLTITRLQIPTKVIWTGVGRYNPTNGQSFEDIIVPAPRIDEPSRPYGRFTATMHCKTDPWLNPSIKCDQISPKVDEPAQRYGQLGPEIVQAIYSNARPFTSIMREDAVRSLNAQYQTYEAALARQRKGQEIRQAPSPQTIYSQIVFPSIVSPITHQTFYAQSPIPIKLAPPSGWNVTSYLVSIQRKDASGKWIIQTNIPVSAAEAQSAQGYMGFGAGGSGPTKSPAFLTAPGTWGARAQIASPRQSGWSDIVEFIVMAPRFTAPAAAARRLVK